MSTRPMLAARRRAVVALAAWVVLSGFTTVAASGVANADCTGADFGAGAGCPPPGDSSGTGNAEAWPPTSVDWPPSQSSESAGGSEVKAATPIVLPDGRQPAVGAHSSSSDSTSTSSSPTPTPIVIPTTTVHG